MPCQLQNHKTRRDRRELKSIKIGNPKPNRVLDNRPVRFYIGDVAKFLGVTVEDVRKDLTELVDQR